MIQTNIALYCKYSVNAEQHFQWILMLLLAVTVVSLPFWQMFMTRAGLFYFIFLLLKLISLYIYIYILGFLKIKAKKSLMQLA